MLPQSTKRALFVPFVSVTASSRPTRPDNPDDHRIVDDRAAGAQGFEREKAAAYA
jgi:hypothetical protein